METAKNYIRIRRPDDAHNHLREGQMLKMIAPTLNIYGRVTVMGNLTEPIVYGEDVKKYREAIMAASTLPLNQTEYSKKPFTPVMTTMLVNYMTPEILAQAFDGGARVLKFIPLATSTNSNFGISFYELQKFYPILTKATELNMILSVHSELAYDRNGKDIHPLKTEQSSLPFVAELVARFPDLKIILEHLSTRDAIEFVKYHHSQNLAASLTEKHAILTYAKIYDRQGCISQPLNYCRPVPNLISDRTAVRKAMLSGHSKFFFGSDSAPHPSEKKTGKIPAAGIYSHSPEAIAILAEIFETEGVLYKLEKFISENWARFTGFPLNQDQITLTRKEHIIPRTFGPIPVFKGGQKVSWTVNES